MALSPRKPIPSQLQAAHHLTVQLGVILDFEPLVNRLAAELRQMCDCERALVLVADAENGILSTAAASPTDSLRLASLSIYGDHPATRHWLMGETYRPAPGDPSLYGIPFSDSYLSAPLMVNGSLYGVVLVENPTSGAPIETEIDDLLAAVAVSAAIALHNACQHTQIVETLDAKMLELRILNQIDRELSDTIRLEHVFDMTLDWAMRYTNANAGSLALYDSADDQLRFVADLGYDTAADKLAFIRSTLGGGIASRVARSAYAELVPDVAADKDHVAVSSVMRSHMSVPVLREDRVIAVIALESRQLNAFTETHMRFVEMLAARAGVAIDNARLYADAIIQQRKLSHILSEIADGVIVVGEDERIILINQSAIASLRLPADAAYIGQHFSSAFHNMELLGMFRRAVQAGQKLVGEVTFPNERIYYVDIAPRTGIGWILVMNDVTPMKQTDQLKRDLIATVSHDLKQPLGVMQGYLDLLQMSQKLDARGENYSRMIERSIRNMRQLIDDLLDLARIDAGIALEVRPVSIRQVLDDCMESMLPLARAKSIEIAVDIAPNLPDVAGEPARLQQIFMNLISNGIKYTPANGHVWVSVERADSYALRVTVRDDGFGIAPEDQARIFDRFYRVRRPENDGIEGTGLGLAIIKKLVDAHGGEIGLESYLGEGSTFFVTLPIYQE